MRSVFIFAAAASTASAQYCSNVNRYSCGAVLEKPDGTGKPRAFDLSSLCLDDGAAYQGERKCCRCYCAYLALPLCCSVSTDH